MNRLEVWKVKENVCTACGEELEKDEFELYYRDGDESNEKMDNIDILCSDCHDSIDKSSRGETELLLEEIEKEMPNAPPEEKSLEFLRRTEE